MGLCRAIAGTLQEADPEHAQNYARRLEKQGLVHKLVTDEGACWQYCDCHAHRDCILLKCEVCGAIQHMDCGHLGELYQHVLQRHHFRINPRRTLFYGLCDRCSGEEPS